MEVRIVAKQEVDDKGNAIDLHDLPNAGIGAIEAATGLFIFSHAVVVQ